MTMVSCGKIAPYRSLCILACSLHNFEFDITVEVSKSTRLAPICCVETNPQQSRIASRGNGVSQKETFEKCLIYYRCTELPLALVLPRSFSCVNTCEVSSHEEVFSHTTGYPRLIPTKQASIECRVGLKKVGMTILFVF